MMELLAFFPLVFMIRSDFKERVIGLYPLLIFGILAAGSSGVMYGAEECLLRMVRNGAILLLLVACSILYLSVRYRGGMNPFREYMGSGDLWFLVCLLPSFGMLEYTRFLIVSFLFSLAWWGGYMGWGGKRGTIPLVSTVGICYVVYLLLRFTFRGVVL